MSAPSRRPSSRAFTLLELIVVIVVLGILAALAIPTFSQVINSSEESVAAAELEAVARNAVALATFDQDRPPTPEQWLIALSESGVSAAGVAAAPLVSGDYSVSTDAEGVSTGPGSLHLTYDGNRVGVARAVDGGCAVVVVVGTTVGRASFVDGGACDGPRALAVADGDDEQAAPGDDDDEDLDPIGSAMPPAAPEGVAAVESGDDVAVSWSPVAAMPDAPVTGYRVFRQPSGGSDWSSPLASTVLPSFTDTAPGDGTWCYRVGAYGDGGDSALSDPSCVEVSSLAPPATPTASATADLDDVMITWSAASTEGAPLTGYELFRQPSGGDTWDETSLLYSGTSTIHTDSDRPAGTWCYRVRAFGPGGVGELSAPSCVVTTATPLLTRPYTINYTYSSALAWQGLIDASGTATVSGPPAAAGTISQITDGSSALGYRVSSGTSVEILVDFGPTRVVQLTDARVYTYLSGSTDASMAVHGSNDGSTWTSLGTAPQVRTSSRETRITMSNPATFRYIRITHFKPSGSYITTNEIELFGSLFAS